MTEKPVYQSTRLLLLIGLGIAALIQLRPVDDVDVFWQLKLGQQTLEQRQLVTGDPFSYTHAGEPVPTIGWLAQVIFAAAFNIGGWLGLKALHALLYAGSILIAARIGKVQVQQAAAPVNLYALAAAMVMGFLVVGSNTSLRPQSIAFFCFSMLMWASSVPTLSLRQWLVMIVMMVIWQNSHPSLMIGGLVLAVLTGMQWGLRLLFRQGPTPWTLTTLLALTLLAQLATPMGYTIFQASAANLDIARQSLGVSEWLPPWHESVRSAMSMFWLALFISIFLFIRLKAQVRVAELILFLVMTGLVLSAARFVTFWALVMIPIWVRWLGLAWPRNSAPRWDSPLPNRRSLVAILAAGLLLSVCLPAIISPSVLDAGLPMQGIVALRQAGVKGRIYNYREWAGPLIWAEHPNWKVAIDGRLYLYPLSDWREYNQAALGKIPLEALVEKHQPDAFFLRPSFHAALIEQLNSSPGWKQQYADDICAVFIPAQ